MLGEIIITNWELYYLPGKHSSHAININSSICESLEYELLVCNKVNTSNVKVDLSTTSITSELCLGVHAPFYRAIGKMLQRSRVTGQ